MIKKWFLFVMISIVSITLVSFKINVWGWLILTVTYILPFIFSKMFYNKLSYYIYFYIISAFHVICIVNSYYFNTFGTDNDSRRFLEKAVEIHVLNKEIIFEYASSSLYSNLLGFLFNIFGYSKMFAMELSVLAFTFSIIGCLMILEFLNKLFISNYFLILYGFLPTVVIYAPIIMRESYEMLFFVMFCYYGLKYIGFKKVKYFIFALVALIMLAALHRGLILLIPTFIFVLIIISWSSFKGKYNIEYRFTKPIKLFMGLVLSVGLIIAFLVAVNLGFTSSVIQNIQENGVKDALTKNVVDEDLDGASYYAEMDFSNLFTFIFSLSQIFIFYSFKPFIWDVRGIMDVYALLEGLMRLIFYYYIIRYLFNLKDNSKKYYIFMFSSVILIELLWSIGTTNWGTALRHHLVAYGVFLILGLISMKNKRGKLKL